MVPTYYISIGPKFRKATSTQYPPHERAMCLGPSVSQDESWAFAVMFMPVRLTFKVDLVGMVWCA